MILALLPILAFGAPVEDSADKRTETCVSDHVGGQCCTSNPALSDLFQAAKDNYDNTKDCDNVPAGFDQSPNDMAAENGWSTDDLTINTQLGKCVFHCDYVDWDAVDPQVNLEVDEEAAAAVATAVGAGIFLVLVLPILIGICICACLIYCLCCRKKQPQTVIVQQAAQ